MKHIGIISDTHSYMDERIIHHLSGFDEIWHAGDIGDYSVVEALRKVAPRAENSEQVFRAVYGNIDNSEIRSEFGLNEIFEIDGLKIWMTHIAGRPGRYPARIKKDLAKVNPDIFICGHSHICMVQRYKAYNLLHLNPGAAGNHGFHKKRTLLRMVINQGQIKNLEVVELGSRGN